MQRARIIGSKNEKTATGAIFVRMCDMIFGVEKLIFGKKVEKLLDPHILP